MFSLKKQRLSLAVSSEINRGISDVSSESKFVEKVFTDQTGRQFQMLFIVALVNGELKGRLVSVEPLTSDASKFKPAQECQFFLPISLSNKKTVTEYVADFTPIVSPYTELYFFMSQPTRAPSIK